MKTQSHSAARVVRLSAAELDGPGWLEGPDGRGPVRFGFDRTAVRSVADTGPRLAPPDAEPEQDVGSFWWGMVFSLMEGFALYGAALHPTAAMPVHAILAARKDLELKDLDLEPDAAEPVQSSAAVSHSNVVKLDRVGPSGAQPERRWHWLRAAGESLTALFAWLRRERQIRQAVVALQELDDRTLRDLGIRCRSEIEWTVRYCRDC
ncbi:DUF1127 domain-containing protein [Bradyrhizobium sp.]|jgi:uncharacterized protein YjiS (DUF1127 family)|uniref:DUF1127 domain-containing protein n=1 Tax=Bradyrhizobium sp. TaxID=376 RepID=UPI002DDD4ADF|nr:DUF1127 domain-containing protein [Bradyrhizobium sp.]HEV2153717.1 DUF1127 domain-containing protein [Bradyrhizobium sp.]